MSRPASLLTAVAVVLAASAPACAATMQATFSGIVSEGFDQSGLFGPAQGDLAGTAYELSLVYDTSQGLHDLSVPYAETLSGGTSSGSLPAPVSAALRVNGVIVALSGAYRGFVASCAAASCGLAEFTAEASNIVFDAVTGALLQTYVSQSLVDAGSVCAITGQLEVSSSCVLGGATADATLPGFFQIYRDDGQSVIDNTYGYMVPDHFSLVSLDIAPVPVPAPVPILMLLVAVSTLVGIARLSGRTRSAAAGSSINRRCALPVSARADQDGACAAG